MKMTSISLYSGLLLLFASLLLTPPRATAMPQEQTTLEDVRKESRELLQSLRGYSAGQRDEALAKIKETLDALDRRINTLEKKIASDGEKMDQAARAKARTGLQELRQERLEVAKWYNSLQKSSAAAWEETKKVFAAAYFNLSVVWEKFEIEFNTGE